MARSSDDDRQLIRHAIEHGELDRLQDILAIVRRTGALQATRQAARDEADAAIRALSALPDSAARKALLELCARSVERSS
jgi:octaprenyl-diphosphate synthase